MFCGNCGKPIAYANAKFCPACGAPVRVQPDAANEPPKVPVPPRPEEPETPAVSVVEPTPATVGQDAPIPPQSAAATPEKPQAATVSELEYPDDDATRILTPAPEPGEDEGATRIFGFDEPAAPIAEQPAAAPQPETPPAPEATAPLFASAAPSDPNPVNVGPNSNSAPIPPQSAAATPEPPQAAPAPNPAPAQSPFPQSVQPTQPITPNPTWQTPPEPEVFSGAKKEKKPGNGPLIFVIVLAVLILAGGGLYFANDYFMLGLEKIPQKLGLVEEIVPDETALPAAEAPTGGSTADTPAAEPTAQPAQTPAPAATAAPTTEPQAVAATADSVVLHGVPDGATITINGQNAAATVQNGDAALSKTALGDAAQLRVIANQGGNWRAAAIWYTADQGSEITLSDSDFLYSGSEDGYLEPDDAFLENVALNYYKAFLNAVNDHDLSEMRFSTARNTDEQSSHVFSDLNAGNTYDTSTASCTLDGSSITWGTYSLTVNASYMCVREDRDTAVREINSNHRTICMVWQDGMWQVDDIAFLSDDDFAAHKYADLNK